MDGSAEGLREAQARPWDDPDALMSVDAALEQVLSAVRRLETVSTPLLEAVGSVLSEDIVADVDLPPFRNSAMDGYAVWAGDTRSASLSRPVALNIVGEQPAGISIDVSIRRGECVRIMTGAPMPSGADAVVRFEEIRCADLCESRAAVLIDRKLRSGENVREAGEDIRRGEPALPAGTLLRSAEVGLLAALNRTAVPVYRRPRVGVVATGDEVVDLGPDLLPGQIRNSNSYLLAALIHQCGGEPVLLGVARDRVTDVMDVLKRAPRVDLIVTSGGVSIGDFDVVKDALRAAGQIVLWQVRIKPGRPLAFGRVGDTPLLGLPGNPVAAAVGFLQFGWPALMKLRGCRDCVVPTVRARLLDYQENRGGRRHFVSGIAEWRGREYVARQVSRQGSGMLTSLAGANCLIVLPETCDHVEAGAEVDVQFLPSAVGIV